LTQQLFDAAPLLDQQSRPPVPPPCTLPHLDGLLPESLVTWHTNLASTLEQEQLTQKWKLGHSFEARLELKHCSLRRFSANQARQCLAHRPLVFVGDSLSRYM
jgi:hypothetical protein